MKRLVNAILFQIIWFVCVLAGNIWAVVATAVYLFVHDRYFMNSRREWRLLAVFLGLGLLVDGALFQIGLFSINHASTLAQPSLTANLPPIWLLCLWISVGSLFAHSLAMLRSRYALSALLGAIGPTFSYLAGANLSGITLAEPTLLSALVVALIWSLILPLGVWLSEQWTLFSTSGES